MKLTANQIRYLLVIRQLNEEKHIVKSVDIANIFGYSRASVHKMLVCLRRLGCVEKGRHCSVNLTLNGAKMAKCCQKDYDQLTEVLKPLVKIDESYSLAICNLIEKM
ncbi:MAG: helix-turn-helix domain-containing protein [Erysipelotrichaceae bacterium]|nr:helix-turn-helix domain-containing protein [Erysipelotrichaceae bacterium]